MKKGIPTLEDNGNIFDDLLEISLESIGQGFINRIAIKLSEWLNAERIIFGKIDDNNQIVNYPIYQDVKIIPNFSDDINKTLCDTIIKKGYCEYFGNITQLFPENERLLTSGVKGFVGSTIYDKEKTPVGVLYITSDKVLQLPPETERILKLVGNRLILEFEQNIEKEATVDTGLQLNRKNAEFENPGQLLQETKEKLLVNENHYRSLFENTKEPALLLYEDSIIDCNQAAIEAIKVNSKSELINLKPWEISPEFQPDGNSSILKAKEYIQKALKEGFCNFNWVHKNKRGESIWYNLSLTRVNIEGKTILYTIWRDISKRKEAEEELIKSEMRFRELFVNSPVAYQSLDKNGVFIDLNDELAKLLECKTKDLLGQRFDNFWIKNNRPKFKERFGKFCKEGRVSNELQLVTKTGKEITVLALGKVQYDANGKFVKTHCVLHDITKRKDQERELKLMSDKLSKAQKLGSVGHFEWYKTTDYVSGSDEYFRIWESNQEEHNNYEHFINSVDPDDREKVNEALDYAIRNKQYYDVEYSIVVKDGRRKYIHAIGEFNFDSNGIPTYLLGMIHDVTKQKEAEKKIIDSEQHLKTIFDASQVGISLNRNRKILFANHYMCQILGYTFEELVGKDSSSFYPTKEEYELAGKKLVEGLKDNNSVFQEVRLKTKGNEIIYVLASSSYYNGKDNTDGIITVLTDISKLKKVERELKKSDKEKNKFFSIIAHDLRGPFGGVMGVAKMLEKDFFKTDDKQKLTYISLISSSVNKTYQLLENLLTWSRSQLGKIKYIPEKIKVKDFVDEVVSIANAAIKNKGITVHTEVSEDLNVFADKHTIDAVLRNLLSNAIKFTNKNGVIFIGALLCKNENQQNQIEISVKDNGVGISKTRLDQLFSIEENQSTAGTEKEEGTGLGLILCKEFIEKNKGEIWVESKLKKGTTFKFTLPEFEVGFVEGRN